MFEFVLSFDLFILMIEFDTFVSPVNELNEFLLLLVV
jgi:hypothetical protein